MEATLKLMGLERSKPFSKNDSSTAAEPYITSPSPETCAGEGPQAEHHHCDDSRPKLEAGCAALLDRTPIMAGQPAASQI